MQRREHDGDGEDRLEFEAFELHPQPLRLMPEDDARRRMRENMAREASLAQDIAARFEEQRVKIEDMQAEIAWLKERVTGKKEGHKRGPTHEGPLYYSESDTFLVAVEVAVEQCVKDLDPVTPHNVGRAMQPLKISEGTLRNRFKDHNLLAPGQSLSQYLRAMADGIRRKKGYLLLGLPLIGTLGLVLADLLFISDPVVAQALDHVQRLLGQSCH